MTPATAHAPRPVMPASPTTPFLRAFTAARRSGVPILATATPDPAATIASIVKREAEEIARHGAPDVAILQWDVINGVAAVNPNHKLSVATAEKWQGATLFPPSAALVEAQKFPDGTILFCHNIHKHLTDAPVLQAIWNLRDTNKEQGRMLILLAPSIALPAELAGDVVVLDEPLPNRTDMTEVILQGFKNAGLSAPGADVLDAALDAVIGLPLFTAEQVVAMSMSTKGLQLEQLWDRKRQAIKNTQGLSINTGWASLDDLQGLDNVVGFLRRLIAAKAFGAIAFIDEGDKALAGGMAEHTGDSGVGKDQVGTLLSYMQDTRSLGVLFAGLAGTGKTQLARAVGAESGKPVITFDLGAMKGGTVGDSERNIREALKVLTATAEGRVLFIMTANKTTIFSPELNRRFNDQFFMDLPSAEARAGIWAVYLRKAGLTPELAARPDGFDDGWTGDEIERVCYRAAMFQCSVVEAGQYIVPSAKSAAAHIEAMRAAAVGRFLSASHPGLYGATPTTVMTSRPTRLVRPLEAD